MQFKYLSIFSETKVKLFYLFLCFILVDGLAFAKDITYSPINIDADHLEFDQEKNQAVFIGKVVVVQNGTELHADKLVVHYLRAKNSGELTNKKINKIESYGNIKFISNDKIAYSDNALYSIKDQMLEMHGNVKLIQNKSVLYGEKLIYNMKTKHARLISKKNQGRVRAVINKDK